MRLHLYLLRQKDESSLYLAINFLYVSRRMLPKEWEANPEFTMLNGSCLCQSVKWSVASDNVAVKACNCTACRRYGVLWTYGHEGEDIHVQGETTAFARGSKNLSFHFCPHCGCVAYWRSNSVRENGKRRIAVNLRTVNNPEEIFSLPVDHFDGFEKWESLPSDGKCVRDIWF